MPEFEITPDTMVVTSSYVTQLKMPILYVSHERDEDGGSLWQFHCGNNDYSTEKLQLVRLDTILKIDPKIDELSALPLGHGARRKSKDSSWEINRE